MFSSMTSVRIASLSAARLKKITSRKRARMKRSQIRTPFSTAALSRGLSGRAGSTVTP